MSKDSREPGESTGGIKLKTAASGTGAGLTFGAAFGNPGVGLVLGAGLDLLSSKSRDYQKNSASHQNRN
jgi:hypothetical protein